ncbi:caspase family protein [Streptomyces sp. NPDC046182]|uniref:caspase, EACC1-associated type n=1 Tax=Streptomyces sp. NPDC046182 TaxID=3154601 RepID=UPI0034102A76
MPGERGDLAAANCHAVVVGTGRYGDEGAAGLADLPSAARSAHDIADVLRRRCGMEGRVTEVIDPQGPTEVLAAVQAAIDASEAGVVLFFFVGHGLLGPGRQLYLATSGTASPGDTVHAVPYDQISKRLGDATASPVVVLDCCFSGLADAAPQDSYRELLTSARPEGSFLLTSATHYAASFAPEGARHTLFSGELLRLLTEGDAGGPAWFTLLDLYRSLDQRFQGGPARPHSDGVGRAADLRVARNPGRVVGAETEAVEPQSEGPCPYPGMRPFLPEQHHLFFGREELTRSLVERVRSQESAGPVVLVGPSGAGKSSLLRAGLVAALATERVLLVPGAGPRPFHTLAEMWAAAVGRPFAEVERELGAGRFGTGGGPDVVVVDQLEEIFTQCQDVEERELFVRAISGPPDDNGPRIVLGLRADFYGQCLNDARLARIVREGQFTVAAMSDDELRAAVERPAEHAGLGLEDGLADHILRELRQERAVEGDAVALPFLAHALRQTWARRHGDLLTYAGYQAAGGIRTSVARTADELYDSLDPAGQRTLRELMLRMVLLVDDGGRAVRRRVPSQDLAGVSGLVGRLAEDRLVVVDEGEAQLCHDSLLYAWPRLRDWILEDRSGLLERRRLGAAAEGWHEAGRPDSGLYGGDQLASARARLGRGGGTLPIRPVERDFLQASDRAQRRSRAVRRTAVAVVVVLAVLASVLAVVARGAQRDAENRATVLMADQLASQADTMRRRDPQTALRLSLAAYRLADTPASRSSLYSSYLTLTPVELPADERKPVHVVAFSSDGKLLATSQRGGRVALWDVSRASTPRKATSLELTSSAAIAFHPRQRLLAAQTATELVLWDVADPAKPRRLARRAIAGGATFTAAFSPDGRTLATGSAAGKLRLWDVSEPSDPRLRAEPGAARGDVVALSFNREGLLATGHSAGTGTDAGPGASASAGTGASAGAGAGAENGKATVQLWNVGDPSRSRLLDTANPKTVMAIAFHPRRDLLLAAGAESETAWWTVEAGSRLVAVPPGEEVTTWPFGYKDIRSLSFHPDGVMAAGADSESQEGVRVRVVPAKGNLYDENTGAGSLPGAEPVQSVAYSPDGRHLAVGDVGGRVRIWPATKPAEAVDGEVHDYESDTDPVSPDGRFLLTQVKNPDSSVVWDLATPGTAKGAEPRRRFTLPHPWSSRAFLPGRDRPIVLAHRFGDAGKNVYRFWTFDDDHGQPDEAGEITYTTTQGMTTAVSSDGNLLVLSSSDHATAQVWDVRDVRRPVKLSDIPVLADVRNRDTWFMGDRALVTADNRTGDPDGYDLTVWDLSDPRSPRESEGRIALGHESIDVEYLPESELVVVQEANEMAQLWDVSDPTNPREGGRLPVAPYRHWSAGQDRLVTSLKDGKLQFWDVSDVKDPKVTKTMRFDLEIEELQFSPAGDQAVTISAGDQPYRIWDIGPDGEWRTPEAVTLDAGTEVVMPASPHGSMLVQGGGPRDGGTMEPKYTFLLDRDTDAIHERLCARYPLSVEKDQWEALFPHLPPQRSCD